MGYGSRFVDPVAWSKNVRGEVAEGGFWEYANVFLSNKNEIFEKCLAYAVGCPVGTPLIPKEKIDIH